MPSLEITIPDSLYYIYSFCVDTIKYCRTHVPVQVCDAFKYCTDSHAMIIGLGINAMFTQVVVPKLAKRSPVGFVVVVLALGYLTKDDK